MVYQYFFIEYNIYKFVHGVSQQLWYINKTSGKMCYSVGGMLSTVPVRD